MTATTKQNETKSLVYSTRIDIPVEMRSQVNTLLNQSLATAIDLKTQIKYAHWNVKGKDFYKVKIFTNCIYCLMKLLPKLKNLLI